MYLLEAYGHRGCVKRKAVCEILLRLGVGGGQIYGRERSLPVTVSGV